MALQTHVLCALIIFVAIHSHCICEAHAFCSLEKMKKFAVEACERLFLDSAQSTSRLKREYHHKSKYNSIGYHNQKHMYAVRHSRYPEDGYLMVSKRHFKDLTKLGFIPYRKKNHMSDGYRHKRAAYEKRGLSYCCYNECDEAFFCG